MKNKSGLPQEPDRAFWFMVLCVVVPALVGFALGYFHPPAVAAPKVTQDMNHYSFHGAFQTFSNVVGTNNEKVSKWATNAWSRMKQTLNNLVIEE